jgi:branched-subunit amino acid ABC-type transport system permease component
MVDFVQNCLDGLTIGSSYAMLAVGFALVFGVMGRLNLSYGPSIMLGAFVGTYLFVHYKVAPWAVAAATVLGAIVAGAYVERVCFWAIRRTAAVASMVSSFAIWMQLEEGAILMLPDRTYPFPPLMSDRVLEIGLWFIRVEYLVMFIGAAGVAVGLQFLLYRTRFGLAVRAVSEDRRASRFLGVNIAAVTFGAFALASLIGGIAGFLILAADAQVTPFFGLWATFKGLIAMMLGGMGSIPGAIVGGLFLGVVEAQSQWYLGTEYRDLAAFGVLFAFLVFRPGGLLAQRGADRRQAVLGRV